MHACVCREVAETLSACLWEKLSEWEKLILKSEERLQNNAERERERVCVCV